jgi:hypothetical protein
MEWCWGGTTEQLAGMVIDPRSCSFRWPTLHYSNTPPLRFWCFAQYPENAATASRTAVTRLN